MTTLLVILHVIVSLFLIFVVLVQGGKGAELGAAFGGSSQTLFGGRGAATFLNKLTTGVAIVFMLTSLVLAVVSTRGTSVVKQMPSKAAPAGQPAMPPQAPAQAPATAPQQQQAPIPLPQK